MSDAERKTGPPNRKKNKIKNQLSRFFLHHWTSSGCGCLGKEPFADGDDPSQGEVCKPWGRQPFDQLLHPMWTIGGRISWNTVCCQLWQERPHLFSEKKLFFFCGSDTRFRNFGWNTRSFGQMIRLGASIRGLELLKSWSQSTKRNL